MANIINYINGVNFCNNALTVNNVVQSNVLNVDSINQNCEGEQCYTCGPLQFSYSNSDSDCATACLGECGNYYSKDYGTAYDGKPTGCTECNLQIGVPIYTDTACNRAANGFYSPKNCSVECNRCYTVVGGIITAINTCPESCTPCDNGVMLAFNESSCELACEEDFCRRYWSDGDCDLCPLIVGDYLYTTVSCGVPLAGYYSNNRCIEDEDCEVCYQVDVTGKIVAVTSCEPAVRTCREINMTIIPQETCNQACKDNSCITRWTDRPLGQLVQAGDNIYDNSECECRESFWSSIDGFFQVWGSGCAQSPIPPLYNQCAYKAKDSCEIIQVSSCMLGPIFTVPYFKGDVSITRTEVDERQLITTYLINVAEGIYEISLMTEEGETIEVVPTDGPIRDAQTSFDLNYLPVGEYVINIKLEEGGDSPLNHRFIWAGSEEVL